MLIKTTDFEMKFFSWILKPVVSAVATAFCIYFIRIENPLASMIAFCIVYAVLLSSLGCFRRDYE